MERALRSLTRTPSALVAAAPASQSKGLTGSHCTNCEQALSGAYSPHLCSLCGYPQPVSKTEDYFGALGAPRRFGQDLVSLQKKFYELSRVLHPDRFTGKDELAKSGSLERMSFLNQAYNTLKNPEERGEYLLELEGLSGEDPKQKTQIPLELAESWFELQDQAMEDPAGAAQRLSEFEKSLLEIRQRDAAAIEAWEREYDTSPTRQSLEKIAAAMRSQAYLKSLQRDVDRMKMRLAV